MKNQVLSGQQLDSIAIERLKIFEPHDGYWIAYSGGKDSDVVLNLVRKSGVKYTAHHALTTADPPEVVQHVKRQRDVNIHRPKRTMWQLIRYNGMPPRRNARYCCRSQKEPGGAGYLVVTGIRREEGANRSKRQMLEPCYRDNTKRYLNLIVNWTTGDVWDYLRSDNVSTCSLYVEGFVRLGCVLCPMVRTTWVHLQRWPRICRAWERAIKATYKAEKTGFRSEEEYWQWWLSRDSKAPPKDRTNWLFDPWESEG